MFRWFKYMYDYYEEFTDRNEENCKTVGDWINEYKRIRKLINQKQIPHRQVACAYDYMYYCNRMKIQRFNNQGK